MLGYYWLGIIAHNEYVPIKGDIACSLQLYLVQKLQDGDTPLEFVYIGWVCRWTPSPFVG